MVDTEPLPSWNNGAPKSAILGFVGHVTTQGGPDFVPPAERIATFDNDGTLCCEQPLQIQFLFLFDRVKELAGRGSASRSRRCWNMITAHSLGLADRRCLNLFSPLTRA
jgi:hypothetical protein